MCEGEKRKAVSTLRGCLSDFREGLYCVHVCARVRMLVSMHAHLHRQIRTRMYARTYMTRHNILIDMHA